MSSENVQLTVRMLEIWANHPSDSVIIINAAHRQFLPEIEDYIINST